MGLLQAHYALDLELLCGQLTALAEGENSAIFHDFGRKPVSARAPAEFLMISAPFDSTLKQETD